MILYVNGDTHAMAAEAANNYKVASEDPVLIYLGNLPHPANLSISWAKNLSLAIRAGLYCEATLDATVETIITSTRNWIDKSKDGDMLIIIQWPLTQEHEEILQFHKELTSKNIKHIFFNSVDNFGNIQNQYDWGSNYIEPYSNSYTTILKNAKIETVSPISEHFGKDGHTFWNRFLLNHIIKHKFI